MSKFGLNNQSNYIFRFEVGYLEFGQIITDPNLTTIIRGKLINHLLTEQTINFDWGGILKGTNGKKLGSFLGLQYDKITNHLRNINNIKFFDLKLPINLNLRQSINMASNAHKIACHLWKSNTINIASGKGSSKTKW